MNSGCLPVSTLRISPAGPTLNLPSLVSVAALKSGGQLYLSAGHESIGYSQRWRPFSGTIEDHQLMLDQQRLRNY